nr:hypothetical protein [uncultured Desulfobacter sp.]
MNQQCKINELIPHKYPFSFVDTVTDYQENEWIRGTKTVSRNDRMSFAVSPVLVCEALAQLSKILEIASTSDMKNISFLASIQVEFFREPKIGDCIELFARVGKKMGEMVSFEVEAAVENTIILKGVIFRRRNAG